MSVWGARLCSGEIPSDYSVTLGDNNIALNFLKIIRKDFLLDDCKVFYSELNDDLRKPLIDKLALSYLHAYRLLQVCRFPLCRRTLRRHGSHHTSAR